MKKINTSKMKHKLIAKEATLTTTTELTNDTICKQWIAEQVAYNSTTIKALWNEIEAKDNDLVRYESKPVSVTVTEPYKSIIDAIAIKEYSHLSQSMFTRKLYRLYSTFNFVMNKYLINNNGIFGYRETTGTNEDHQVYMGGARYNYHETLDILVKHNLITKTTNITYEANQNGKHIGNSYVINGYTKPTGKHYLQAKEVMVIQSIMTLKKYSMNTYNSGKITTFTKQSFANMKIPTWSYAKYILEQAVITGELSGKGKKYVYDVKDSDTETSVYDALGSYIFADDFEILANKEEQLRRVENWGSLIPKIIRKRVLIKCGRTYEHLVESDYQSLFINLFLSKFDTNGNTTPYTGDSATKFANYCNDTFNTTYNRKDAKDVLNTFMNRGHNTKPWLLAKGSCGHYDSMTDVNGNNVWNMLKAWLPSTVICAFETYKLNDKNKNDLFFELCAKEVKVMQDVCQYLTAINVKGIYCYDAIWIPKSVLGTVKAIMNQIISEHNIATMAL